MRILSVPAVTSSIRPTLTSMAAPTIASWLLLALAWPAGAQSCLHGQDESASERGRREAALAFVDQVNAAQKAAQDTQGTYVALADAISPRSVPLGFVPRLTFDRWSYAVSLKDLFDPCGFALFSDQDGLVYEARPVSRTGDASARVTGDASRVSLHRVLVLPPAGAIRLQQRDKDDDEGESTEEGEGFEHMSSTIQQQASDTTLSALSTVWRTPAAGSGRDVRPAGKGVRAGMMW